MIKTFFPLLFIYFSNNNFIDYPLSPINYLIKYYSVAIFLINKLAFGGNSYIIDIITFCKY